ncbi:MAG: hypothetical protein ACE5DP_01810 [Fidelibacterota bacterium]
MYWQWRLLLPLLLLLATPSWGIIQGQVVTTEGAPLPYVYISDPAGQVWTQTDEYGEFQLPTDWPTNDSLTFSRYGYQSRTLKIPPHPPWVIALVSQPIGLEPVEVRPYSTGFTPYRFTHTKSMLDETVSQGQFRRLPSALLRSYGGPAGNASLALDGGAANQVKVVLEGIDITNPQNGETDLSQLPGTMINHLALAPLPGVLYGSGAVDGVLQLSSREEPTHVRYSRGSWGLEQWVAKGHIARRKWRSDLQGGVETYQGNYPYEWHGESKRRSNNQFTQRFGAYKLNYHPTARQFVRGFLFFSRQERGVSGPIQAASSTAQRKDRLSGASLRFSRLFQRGYHELLFTGRWSTETYRQPAYNIDSDHKLQAETIRYHLEARLRPTLRVLLQGEGKWESIRSTDVGTHHRQTLSAVTGIDYTPYRWLTLNPTVRWEQAENLYQIITYNLRLGTNLSRKINLNLNGGTSFRYPTFNDLYWRPGGNPDLKPEETITQSLDFQRLFQSGSMTFTLTNKYSTNLIRWVPDSTGWWQAQNDARTQRLSGTLQMDYNRDYYRAYSSVTLLKSYSLSTHKTLLYTPRFLATGSLEFTANPFTINVNMVAVSQRIARYDYPENITLAPYALVALGITYSPLRFPKLTLILTVDNLLNQTYQATHGYPEPGRSLSLTIVYQPSLKKTESQ